MTSRDAILSRVKEALSVPTIHPAPHEPHLPSSYAEAHVDLQPRTQWMVDPGDNVDAWQSYFAALSEKLKTEFLPVASLDEAKVLLQKIAKDNHWKKIATHHAELTDALCADLACEQLTTTGGYDKVELETCAVGISECESLIAQTGSVLITSESSGGRALSVLPPHHIVIARTKQLLPDLSTAYAQLAEKYKGDYPSLISFITGPSRTGDIERTLVLGAHGPKRLTIILINER